MSRSESLDAFIAARKEDPDTRGDLTPGELIACAKYHLDFVVASSAAGQRGDHEDQEAILHFEEALMSIGQALAGYRKNMPKKAPRRARPA